MFIMEYCAEGEPISDFEAEAWLERVKPDIFCSQDKDTSVRLSTSLPFNLIRREIARGNLDCRDVMFVFNGLNIAVNKHGAIPDSPNGFCEAEVLVCQEILWAAMNARKREKSK